MDFTQANKIITKYDTGDPVNIQNTENFFEGAEKNLKIWFKLSTTNKSLIDISKETWESILNNINCKIIGDLSNSVCKSYILSESSLFVFKKQISIKTCGTIILLKILEPLRRIAEKYGANVESICYTRKKFLKPLQQFHPHISFKTESDYINEILNVKGEVFEFDDFFIYLLKKDKIPNNSFEMLMNGIGEYNAGMFYNTGMPQEEVTLKSGIKSYIPNSLIKEHMFNPCGYSMNGLRKKTFWTIHVTPEKDFSYSSFETNKKFKRKITRKVLKTFNPDELIIFSFKCKLPEKLKGYKTIFSKRIKNFFVKKYTKIFYL